MTTEPSPAATPVPLWVWLIVAMVSFGLVFTALWSYTRHDPALRHEDLVGAISFGLILSGGLTGGLALACRVFHTWIGRFAGALLFIPLATVVAAAVVFAGCMCTNNVYFH